MPIEIRELIIKTEISTGEKKAGRMKEKELSLMKQQLFEECRRLISENTKKSSYKR